MISEIEGLNAKLRTVGVHFGANVVFTRSAAHERRQALRTSFDRFVSLFGDDLHFFRVDGTNHE